MRKFRQSANLESMLMSERGKRNYADPTVDPIFGGRNTAHTEHIMCGGYNTNMNSGFNVGQTMNDMRRFEPERFGMITNHSPFMMGYGYPDGSNLHLHGSDLSHVEHGHILDRDRNKVIDFDGYGACMEASRCESANYPAYISSRAKSQVEINSAIDRIKSRPLYGDGYFESSFAEINIAIDKIKYGI